MLFSILFFDTVTVFSQDSVSDAKTDTTAADESASASTNDSATKEAESESANKVSADGADDLSAVNNSDNPGMPFLDQAIEEKLKASDERDLGAVIALAQKARKEGLQGANLKFCDEFIASVQLQRGQLIASRIIGRQPNRLPESWEIVRTRALADLEAAVKTITVQPEVYITIAQLNLMPNGDAEKAKKALDAAEKICGDQPDLLTQVVVIKTMLEKDPVKREAALAKVTKQTGDKRLVLLHAMSLFDLKRYEDAVETLQKILKDEAENPQALQLLFDAYRHLKKYEESLKVLDKLENILPASVIAINRAKIYFDMDKKDESMKILDNLREKQPNNIEIMLLRASLLTELKQFDKAIKDVNEAVKTVGTDNPQQLKQLRILQIQVFKDAGKFEQALEVIDELAKDKEATDEFDLTIMRVDILYNQKQYKNALELLDPLVKEQPENLGLLRLKGNILLSMRRHTDAVKVFEAVIKADPTDKTTLNNLSWILSTSTIDMIRDGKRALELAEQACKLTDYKAAYILSTLAAAYAELGDFKKAIEFSEKSIELSKEDPNVRDRVEVLKEELETYKKNMPYRDYQEDK
ncbi:MAG: tetratricopeptide repeat protein [Planctomycetaceae bacterium]|nr:tetratricopeptide repeat protein [Planctomycetaceae bacterium]